MGLARGWLMSLRLVSGGFNSIHSSSDQSETSNPFPGTTQCPKGPNAPQAWERWHRLSAQGSPGPPRVSTTMITKTTHAPLPATTFRSLNPGIGDCSRLRFSEGVPPQDFNLFFRLHQPPSSVTALGLGWTGSGAALDRRAILG